MQQEISNAGAKKGDDIANALWVAANTKRCPRCTTPIEKDEGCNHMQCRKCQYDFCWICMQEWGLHSNQTGGYFQCNRFVGNEDEESSNNRQIHGNDEAGSAQMESIRNKNKGQRMARFIHHYSRFQAHGDSSSMENKMYKETTSRISDELNATKEGNITWLQGSSVVSPYIEKKETKEIEIKEKEIENNLKDIKIFSQVCVSTPTKEIKDIKDKNNLDEIYLLDFLHNGFRELLKCRLALRGSFSYAFFEFDSDNNNVKYSMLL